MEVRYFEFEFTHQGRQFPATCHVYIKKGETELPYKYPLYRVAVMTQLINPDVYLFYEVNRPGERFFWYSFHDTRDLIAKSIRIELEKLILDGEIGILLPDHPDY